MIITIIVIVTLRETIRFFLAYTSGRWRIVTRTKTVPLNDEMYGLYTLT